MRLEPRKDWVIGRIAITKVSSTLHVPDANRGVTKFVFLEEVSPDAERAGYRIGDLVLPKAMNNIFLKGGTYHRATFSAEDIVCRVHDVPLDELVDTNGKAFEASAGGAAA